MKKFLKATLAAALVAAGLSANAANTVDLVDAVGYGNSAGKLTVAAGAYAGTYNVDAEEWQLTTSTGKTFAAYCIDASTLLAIPPGNYAEIVMTGQIYDSISRLFTVAGFEGDGYKFDDVDSKTKASALQLAIWETYYEGGTLSTADAFSTGNMTVTFFGNVRSQAQSYLTAAAALGVGEYTPAALVFSALPNASRSQLLVTSIPEPSTYALMAACLGVMGLVSRRKQA
jgi:PEP-CTERM motif